MHTPLLMFNSESAACDGASVLKLSHGIQINKVWGSCHSCVDIAVYYKVFSDTPRSVYWYDYVSKLYWPVGVGTTQLWVHLLVGMSCWCRWVDIPYIQNKTDCECQKEICKRLWTCENVVIKDVLTKYRWVRIGVQNNKSFGVCCSMYMLPFCYYHPH